MSKAILIMDMPEDIYDNPLKEYLEYLSRFIKSSRMSKWQAHQLLVPRIVAQMYGVTPEQMSWLDNNL